MNWLRLFRRFIQGHYGLFSQSQHSAMHPLQFAGKHFFGTLGFGRGSSQIDEMYVFVIRIMSFKAVLRFKLSFPLNRRNVFFRNQNYDFWGSSAFVGASLVNTKLIN